MFKILYILTVSVALVYGKTRFVSVPSEQLPILLNKSMECVGKSGIDVDTMQKILTWKFEDTDDIRKFIYCFANSSGIADNDGHIVKDSVTALVGDNQSKDELGNVIDECNKFKGSNKYETLYKVAVCFQEKSPILFKL